MLCTVRKDLQETESANVLSLRLKYRGIMNKESDKHAIVFEGKDVAKSFATY